MKITYKNMFLIFILLGQMTFAASGEFWASVNNDWWNNGNWTGGSPPTGSEDGWISGNAVVGSGIVTFDWCRIGWSQSGSVTVNSGAQFNVYSSRLGNLNGTITTNGTLVVEGYYSASGDTIIGEYGIGDMYIRNNGVVDNSAVTTYLGATDGTIGYLLLDDNAVMSTAWLVMDGFYWPGNPNYTRVQLNGGTLSVGGLSMNGTNGDWNEATIDFDGGTLVVAGDYVSTAYSLEIFGRFTSENGIVAIYNSDEDKTFIREACSVIRSGDLNGDCKVDLMDFYIFAQHWQEDARI